MLISKKETKVEKSIFADPLFIKPKQSNEKKIKHTLVVVYFTNFNRK